MNLYLKRIKQSVVAAAFLYFSVLQAGTQGHCAELIIIGDVKLKPVADVISGIKKSLGSSIRVIPTNDINDNLGRIFATENGKVVVALGKDAVDKTIFLPPTIPVISSLVIIPPKVIRPNTTCIYIATPVNEYLALLRHYFPSLKRIAAAGSPDTLRLLGAGSEGYIFPRQASNSFDLVNKVKQLTGFDALLLMPDVSLLTSTALDEIYLHSFRNRLPVIGVSEKHVRQGALFALVFNAQDLGRQIGEKSAEILGGSDISLLPSLNTRKFDLFINTETAQKMGIAVSEELVRRAKKVYP